MTDTPTPPAAPSESGAFPALQADALSHRFPERSERDWRDAAEKALRGRSADTLDTELPGGLRIEALYRRDGARARAPLPAPGQAPFVRGPRAQPDPFAPWDIRQRFTHPDPKQTNAEILRDLEGGVMSAELCADASGARGVVLRTADDVAAALRGVRADIAGVALDPCGRGTGASVAALLALWAEAQGDAFEGGPKAARLDFNLDPLGLLARTGRVEGGLDAAVQRCGQLGEVLSLRFPLGTVFRADGLLAHEAGASEAQELAVAVAAATDVLRRLEAAGLGRERAEPLLLFRLGLGPDYGVETAKLRALRVLWARCQEALGLDPRPVRLQARSGARSLARIDPWVNMLRLSAAAFAGAAGGADIVTVDAFNSPLGIPEALGRRVARNTQIIAMEEAGLGRVADPMGGGFATEALTAELSEQAWGEFQTIEREGGLAASLGAGALQARIAAVREERLRRVATRAQMLTGVSAFPQLDGVEAPAEPRPAPTFNAAVSPDGLDAFLPNRPGTGGDDTEADPLPRMRLAEAFERLREAADAHANRPGASRRVLLAVLGPLSEHSARLDWTANLLRAGGLEPVLPEGSEETSGFDTGELCAALRRAEAPAAVLVGADSRYGDEAAPAAEALLAAGAGTVALAGKPGKTEGALAKAGVSLFLHQGIDVVEALELLHAELGLS